MKKWTILGDIEIYLHKTWEIVHIIGEEKAELVITMNITRSLLKQIADKSKTVCYFVSCFKDIKDLVKERFFLATCHLKVYATETRVIFSTANLSLSSFDEISIVFKRSEQIDIIIKEIIKHLKIANDFMRAFH